MNLYRGFTSSSRYYFKDYFSNLLRFFICSVIFKKKSQDFLYKYLQVVVWGFIVGCFRNCIRFFLRIPWAVSPAVFPKISSENASRISQKCIKGFFQEFYQYPWFQFLQTLLRDAFKNSLKEKNVGYCKKTPCKNFRGNILLKFLKKFIKFRSTLQR